VSDFGKHHKQRVADASRTERDGFVVEMFEKFFSCRTMWAKRFAECEWLVMSVEKDETNVADSWHSCVGLRSCAGLCAKPGHPPARISRRRLPSCVFHANALARAPLPWLRSQEPSSAAVALPTNRLRAIRARVEVVEAVEPRQVGVRKEEIRTPDRGEPAEWGEAAGAPEAEETPALRAEPEEAALRAMLAPEAYPMLAAARVAVRARAAARRATRAAEEPAAVEEQLVVEASEVAPVPEPAARLGPVAALVLEAWPVAAAVAPMPEGGRAAVARAVMLAGFLVSASS
jgi:hypothetical protein